MGRDAEQTGEAGKGQREETETNDVCGSTKKDCDRSTITVEKN
jgi:hypothetical protein